MKPIIIPASTNRLTGILHAAISPLGKTLIISHGFRGTKDGGGRAVTLAEAVAAIGINVIRYDFTPLQSLSCQIAELTAVVDYTRQMLAGQILLLGRSMGGSASIAVAAADRDISGLILWSTPWNLTATFRQALGVHYERLEAGEILHMADSYGSLILSPDFIQDFRQHKLLTAIKNLGPIPLLILHGAADSLVSVSQAQSIYTQAAGPRKLIVFPNGDHHLTDHASQAGTAIVAWLQKVSTKLSSPEPQHQKQ